MPQSEIIFAALESLERGFEARALSHSIYTEAETFDELKKKVRDAVRCHLEEKKRPDSIRLRLDHEEFIPVWGSRVIGAKCAVTDAKTRQAEVRPTKTSRSVQHLPFARLALYSLP